VLAIGSRGVGLNGGQAGLLIVASQQWRCPHEDVACNGGAGDAPGLTRVVTNGLAVSRLRSVPCASSGHVQFLCLWPAAADPGLDRIRHYRSLRRARSGSERSLAIGARSDPGWRLTTQHGPSFSSRQPLEERDSSALLSALAWCAGWPREV